jgi:hypothetical protein
MTTGTNGTIAGTIQTKPLWNNILLAFANRTLNRTPPFFAVRRVRIGEGSSLSVPFVPIVPEIEGFALEGPL